jgi:hypothetical protein
MQLRCCRSPKSDASPDSRRNIEIEGVRGDFRPGNKRSETLLSGQEEIGDGMTEGFCFLVDRA